jgi:hypothetical protein
MVPDDVTVRAVFWVMSVSSEYTDRSHIEWSIAVVASTSW